MKGDIGMANYEKQVEQEAAYPIPISLYNCYRTVRQEKRGIAIYLQLIVVSEWINKVWINRYGLRNFLTFW